MELNLYLQTLRRGWWLILLTVLVSASVSLLISYFTPPVYQTSMRFVVAPNPDIFSSSWDLVSSLDTLDRRSIVNTYKELLASPTVYRRDPEINAMGVEMENYIILAVVVPETNIIELTVEGPDAPRVALVANAVGEQAISYINQLYPVYIFNVLDRPAIPTTPIRPLPLQSAGLAVIFGGVIGMALAFTKEQFQNTIDKIRERSIIDVVTSAYTRAYFERRLLEDITQNPDGTLCIGIINFRGLRDMTDVLPQPIHDRLLHQLTQTLKEELRGRDIVGRWGTSQLAVLLPSTPSSALESTFNRIKNHLSDAIPLDTTGEMTVRPDPCIGVASHAQFESDKELIKRAELAVEKASAMNAPAVTILARPFVFVEDESLKDLS